MPKAVGPGRRESHALGGLEDARRAAADVGTGGGARGGLVRADLSRAVAFGEDGRMGGSEGGMVKFREKLQQNLGGS